MKIFLLLSFVGISFFVFWWSTDHQQEDEADRFERMRDLVNSRYADVLAGRKSE